MKRLFTEHEVTFEGRFYKTDKALCAPKTVQRPHPPFLIAGGGPRILELAGREADIVAIVPPSAGAKPPRVEDVSLETGRAQLALVRDAAGRRYDDIELSIFVDCVVTDDREMTIAGLAERSKSDPAITRASFYRGIGTLDEIQSHLRLVRRELGITYFCLRGPDIEKLGPVVAELSGS